MNNSLRCMVSCLALALPGAVGAAPLELRPALGPVAAQGIYGLDATTRKSLSGVACPPTPRAPCLVVFDEGTEARLADLSGPGYVARPGPIPLASKGELDLEGAATDGVWFYATGSHAAKRVTCKANPASRIVARVRVGRPAIIETTSALWRMIAAVPALNAGKCADDEGLDIEGLAVRDGRLFFGLRGPAKDAHAYILIVAADALFSATPPARPDIRRIRVGARRGIRDMVAVSDGFLILAGPDGGRSKHETPKPDWALFHWDGASADPVALGTLALDSIAPRTNVAGCSDDAPKPEALFVREETARAYRVSILSDGLCDGGPMLFEVPR